MQTVQQILDNWEASLVKSINLGSLMTRNPIAHKWKATYRSLIIRESCMWRMHDLCSQIVSLSTNNNILGARILLRAAVETTGILIYLNHRTSMVLNGKLSFSEFDQTTVQLMLGCKNKDTKVPAINILTVIKKAEKEHDGLLEMYERLCECAHPNYEGVLSGYTNTDWNKYETNFQNNWNHNSYHKLQTSGTELILAIFEYEYNESWSKKWEGLETWLVKNNTTLEKDLQSNI